MVAPLRRIPLSSTQFIQKRYLTEAEDPDMNGAYISPPPIKRQFRDPYGDWWDKQERRNYGEPVHEDNDILGMFSPEEYTWVSAGKGALQMGCFITAVLGLCGLVSVLYPDSPTVPRTFEDGLDRELGGPGALKSGVGVIGKNGFTDSIDIQALSKEDA